MAEQTTHTLPLREEVPAKDKWHIEDIFSNDDAFTSALEACRTHIDALAAFKDHLGDSAETLCTYLTEKEKVLVELDSLYCYAGHRSDEDTSNPHYQDLRGQVDFTGNHFYETTAFEDPELLSLPEDFIGSDSSEPPPLNIYTVMYLILLDQQNRRHSPLSFVVVYSIIARIINNTISLYIQRGRTATI